METIRLSGLPLVSCSNASGTVQQILANFIREGNGKCVDAQAVIETWARNGYFIGVPKNPTEDDMYNIVNKQQKVIFYKKVR